MPVSGVASLSNVLFCSGDLGVSPPELAKSMSSFLGVEKSGFSLLEKGFIVDCLFGDVRMSG